MGHRALTVFVSRLNRLGYKTIELDRWGIKKGRVLIIPKTKQSLFNREQLTEILKLADGYAINVQVGKVWTSKGHSVARGKYCYNSILKTRAEREKMTDLDKAELDRNVLNVLKTYPGYNLRPGQIVKLMCNKKHNYPNSKIPDFFERSHQVRDSLHRLERAGKAACRQLGRPGRSKRWCFAQGTADPSDLLNTLKTRKT